MKVYLVIWEECDSGFKIKAGFTSKSKAAAEAKHLNDADETAMIADTERWVEAPSSQVQQVYRGPKWEILSLEEAKDICRKSSRISAARLCKKHSVYTVDIK